MVSIVCMAIATIIGIYMVIEIGKAGPDAVLGIVRCKSWNNKFNQEALQDKEEKFLINKNKYKSSMSNKDKKKAKKKIDGWDKQIAQYKQTSEKYLEGRYLTILDIIPLFGYQLLNNLGVDGNNGMLRRLTKVCENTGYIELERPMRRQGEEDNEFNGSTNAQLYARYMLANLVSYISIALFLFFAVLSVSSILKMDSVQVVMLSVVALAAPILAGYLPYDGLNAATKARQEELDREFPNALSKITLLYIAGMTIQNAIEETSLSGDSVIYQELRNVVKDMKSGATLEAAMTRMQYRCDNRFLDRTVSVIVRSYTAGNSNLSQDLRDINSECWLDKKHNSRRLAEVVQNKLFIPTILMFVGLLVCIVVPAMSGFNIGF